MPDEGIRCAQQRLASCRDAARYLSMLDSDEAAFVETARSQLEPEALVLALFMQYAVEQKEKWDSQGIASSIFFDTMRDLTVWYHECIRQTGKPGLMEWEWLILSLKGRLYRLGRLQYLPRKLNKQLVAGEKTYPPGTMMLDVHIPADGKLDYSAVIDSLERARSFFRNGGYAFFYCRSWLLSPGLKQILPKESNILRFQEQFQVYDEDFSFRQAEERVFGAILEDRSQYPEMTSLQQALKKLLLAGGEIGMGCGMILF